MKDLQIVTISSHNPTADYYCLPQFHKSLERFGTDALVIGDKPGEYKGLGSKPKLLLKAIQDKLVDSQYIIFCDCWDLVFTQDPMMILDNAVRRGAPFIISAEKNCFPGDLKNEYDLLNYTSSYRYLNSGFIIAQTEAMLAVLESMDLGNVPDDHTDETTGQKVHINDQFLFQQAFLKQPIPMTLDYMQIFSQTMNMVEEGELDFTDKYIRNKETGAYPCTFHFNGGSKTAGLREPILKYLGL